MEASSSSFSLTSSVSKLVPDAEADSTLAAAPATWGDAIEVPEIVLMAYLDPIQVLVM